MKMPRIPVWAIKSPTRYELQIWRFGVGWVYLYGGGWRHWWQLSRWQFQFYPPLENYDA